MGYRPSDGPVQETACLRDWDHPARIQSRGGRVLTALSRATEGRSWPLISLALPRFGATRCRQAIPHRVDSIRKIRVSEVATREIWRRPYRIRRNSGKSASVPSFDLHFSIFGHRATRVANLRFLWEREGGTAVRGLEKCVAEV